MEFNWNTDGDSATFDHPYLPFAVYPPMVGEVIGYEMARNELAHTEMMHPELAPWTLAELDYAYDAQNVCPNERMDGQSYPLDYYAYSSPFDDSWLDGLQEIEGFEWDTEKDNEQHFCEGEDDKFPAARLIDFPDRTFAVVGLKHCEGTELFLEEDSPLLDKKMDGQTQVPSAVTDTPFETTATTEASYTPRSPPWICSPIHRSSSTHTTTHLEAEPDDEASMTEGGDWNRDASYDVLMEDIPMFPEFETPTTAETLEDAYTTAVASQSSIEDSVMPSPSQTKIAQKEDQGQVQNEEVGQGSPMTGDAHPEDKSPALAQSHPGSSLIDNTLQARLKLSEDVAHADMEAWQAQLQDAARNTSAEDLSIRNSPAHREHSVEPDQAWAVETKDMLMDASSTPARTSPEQHIHSDTVLLPSPFQPELSKTTNPRKRSMRARKAKIVSESDYDAPIKKKARKCVSTNGVSTRTKKSGKGSKEAKEQEELPAMMENGPSMVKESLQLHEITESQAPLTQGKNALSLSSLAYGLYIKPFLATPTPLRERSKTMTCNMANGFEQQESGEYPTIMSYIFGRAHPEMDPDVEYFTDVESLPSLGDRTPVQVLLPKIQKMPKKAPATRKSRKRKASSIQEEDEQEEEVKSAVPQKMQPIVRRSVRQKTQAKRQDELVPEASDPKAKAGKNSSNGLSSVPSTLVLPMMTSLDQNSHEDYEEVNYDEVNNDDEHDSDYKSRPKRKSRRNPKEDNKPTTRSKQPLKSNTKAKAAPKATPEPEPYAESKPSEPPRRIWKTKAYGRPIVLRPGRNKYGFLTRITPTLVRKLDDQKVDGEADEEAEEEVAVEVNKGKSNAKVKDKKVVDAEEDAVVEANKGKTKVKAKGRKR
ncbi:hypothetical protein L13192_02976 [Pyrenophora tritici-repentis]|nr:hypothetical protein L13192_02976 [Pyrenophora tritici-repentis]